MAKVKEENYFDLFIEAAQYTCSTSELILNLVTDYTDVEAKVKAIHNHEHTADGVFRRVAKQLNKSFITPIERDDILHLAQAIDDVIDLLDEIAISFYMLNVTVMRPDARTFAEHVHRACQMLYSGVEEFKKFRKSKTIGEFIVKINDIEDEVDRYYQSAVRNLYMTCDNPIEVQTWREIYAHFENSIDACEDVADLLESIMLKNS